MGYPAVIGFHPEQDPISTDDLEPCLGAGAGAALDSTERVRRLMPIERERLMGWPDDHTRWGIDDNGKLYELKDGPRERLTGNGVVSNLTQWIGQRIVDTCLTED